MVGLKGGPEASSGHEKGPASERGAAGGGGVRGSSQVVMPIPLTMKKKIGYGGDVPPFFFPSFLF